MPHDAVPDCGFLRLFVEVITNADNLCLKVLCPVAIFNVIVIVLSIFRPKRVQNAKRIFHVVVKVPANEVIESFDAIVEDSDIINSSRKMKKMMKE